MKTFNLDKLIREDVRNIRPYRSARDEYQSDKALFMDANENPYGGSFARYPDPLQKELRKAFAKEKNCNARQLLFGNGSDEWIDLLIRVFCDAEKDQMIFCPPTYGMYEVCAAFNGIKAIAVPQLSSFEIDVKGILKKASAQSKLLFLCSPNNPTGKSIPRKQLDLLLSSFPGIIVIDEAYVDFVPENSMLAELQKYPNLIILQTFSKARGLAGLRLGVVFASEAIIASLQKVKLPYNVNQYTQEKALECLQDRSGFEQIKTQILQEKVKLEKALSAFDFIEEIFPSDANFLLLRSRDATALYEFLLKKNIVLRNRSGELHCENCLRISIGTNKQNKILIAAIAAYAEKTNS